MTIKTPKNVVSASCTLDNLENCVATDLTAFTAKYFSKRQFLIPMSAADVALNFPAQFDIFQATTTNAPLASGLAVTTSNLIGGNEVSCPFLMCGICLSITVESNLWATSCGEFAAPVTSPLPLYNGTSPLAAAGPTGTIPMPAVAEYGHCSLRAALAFIESYSLRFLLQCKYELFDVPLSDIGCVDSDEVVGVGDSLIAAGVGFQRINDQNLAIGSTRRAVPAVTQDRVAPNDNLDLAFQPTTRVMLATLLEKGSLNGFYLCPTPILLAPCCRINMAFTEVGDSALSIGGESYQHQRLVQELLNVPAAPYGSDIPGVVAGGAAGSAFNRTLKFGALEIGVTMMGYEITPKACSQYFGNGLPDSLMAMYSMIQGMPGYQPALGTRASAPASGRTQKRANRRSSSPSRGAGEERRFRVFSRGARG